MENYIIEKVLKHCHASEIISTESIQSLWSGYGEIIKCHLKGGDFSSVVVKWIAPPNQINHPRGWHSDVGHNRKLDSYRIEKNWYDDWAAELDANIRVPKKIYTERKGDNHLFIVEDLDSSGYPIRLSQVNESQLKACVKWLADFHAYFLNIKHNDKKSTLWEKGTYWHVETRLEELEVLTDKRLKKQAFQIDKLLSECKYITIVHGDAKLANFCFSETGLEVAALDFQYVGAGCGMKDLAYFLGSCLSESECEQREDELLDMYFGFFRYALLNFKKNVNPDDVVLEWQSLYHLAWVDFHRFLKGWSPGHWKINSYSERLVNDCLKVLEQ